ncbi:RHS repeat domain-containing protein [Pseudomonas sp. RA_35y_Pfl2_P32]|uniref:RHS repeat domain-containing protein n=1 Tax=Pseudomonas sp. RA_35y_Pfl2_P32 TaxID=3088705 RepID=UPI0030DD378F
MDLALHCGTPALAVIDPRGLVVMNVAYHRLEAGLRPEARVARRGFDAQGDLTAQWDARLWADGGASGEPNLRLAYGLSGRFLCSESVDAGWRIALFGDAGQAVEGWDGRGSHRRTVYDIQLRPTSEHEQLAGEASRCVERLGYGGPQEAAANRCGRAIRHDDPAGSRAFVDYGLLGQGLVQTQRFLSALQMPDWPEVIAGREALLEGGQEAAVVYTTGWRHDALGGQLSQTDAVGNTQTSAYDVAGQLHQIGLQAAGESQATLVQHSLAYNASGQVTAQAGNNGVTTTAVYSDDDGRLQHLRVRRPDQILQDLAYAYDPVGSVLSVRDHAQATDWFNGEQLEPLCTYRYDTLGQLIEATGLESAQAGIGPDLPPVTLPGGGDTSRRRRYTQAYTYDAGGNLLQLAHSQAATRTMRVAERSNRSRYQLDSAHPPDLVNSFDGNGNLLLLEGAQAMTWDGRNQLRGVTQVVRPDGSHDVEVYVYGADGQRLRKVRVQQAKAVQHSAEVRYLPGLELRTNSATGETLQVATVQTGYCTVQRLQWQRSRKVLPPAQLRYSQGDHLGSSILELDSQGAVISHEGYYPYGGTAWWAARSAVEADGKTRRYSGKERDATGLYYYGFRYYAPWLSRWLNPDPAGDIDGLNLYGFVANNPGTKRDVDGLFSASEKKQIITALTTGRDAVARARYLLESMPQQVSDIMQTYFGPQHSTVRDEVIVAWTKTEGILSRYAGLMSGSVQDKFVDKTLIKSDSLAGWVQSAEKISVYQQFFDQNATPRVQALTLVHEVTHVELDSDIGLDGAGSEDFFYLIDKYPARDSTRILSGEGLRVGEIEDAKAMFKKIAALKNYPIPYIETVEDDDALADTMLYGNNQLLTLSDVATMVNDDRTLGARFAAQNADSLGYAAMDLGDRFDSIMASMPTARPNLSASANWR